MQALIGRYFYAIKFYKIITTKFIIMKPTIGIPDNNLEEVATLLNTLLADEYVLFTKTRNAHWNITGMSFYEMHKLFQAQYEALDIMIDDIAERVRSIGHFALGSLKDFLSVTNLSEEKDDFSSSEQMIQSLLNDHETIIRMIRNDIIPISDKYKDLGTADFVTGLMEQHEKISWMLRSSVYYIETESESGKTVSK
jgi:starvation-inducible DNA-binding protein